MAEIDDLKNELAEKNEFIKNIMHELMEITLRFDKLKVDSNAITAKFLNLMREVNR